MKVYLQEQQKNLIVVVVRTVAICAIQKGLHSDKVVFYGNLTDWMQVAERLFKQQNSHHIHNWL